MWNKFIHDKDLFIWINTKDKAELAQLVERKALNLVVMGLSYIVGVDLEFCSVDFKPNSNGTTIYA